MKPIFHQIPSNSGSSEAGDVSEDSEPLKESWLKIDIVLIEFRTWKVTKTGQLKFKYVPWVKMLTCVSFIPYFRLLVFGILLILVALFCFRFFPSCPSSCLAKCKQRFHNIFAFLLPKVTKNQKPKMGWAKHLCSHFFPN